MEAWSEDHCEDKLSNHFRVVLLVGALAEAAAEVQAINVQDIDHRDIHTGNDKEAHKVRLFLETQNDRAHNWDRMRVPSGRLWELLARAFPVLGDRRPPFAIPKDQTFRPDY